MTHGGDKATSSQKLFLRWVKITSRSSKIYSFSQVFSTTFQESYFGRIPTVAESGAREIVFGSQFNWPRSDR